MNRSYAWFTRYYEGARVTNVMIIPARRLARDAGFLEPVQAMDVGRLNLLKDHVKAFFAEFRDKDLLDLSESHVQAMLDFHRLSVEAITSEYGHRVRDRTT